jgi:Ca2+-binding EF-hand superfamily protein
VLLALQALKNEWEACKQEDAAALKVKEILELVIPKFERWTQSKQRLGLESGEIQYIERLANNVDAIKLWLSYYKEEGKQHGFLARGLRIAKMAQNVAKKAIGFQTSYDQLLELVKALDENLQRLNIIVTLDIHGVTQDIHAQLSKVVEQQQEVMDKVQQRLNTLPPGSKVPENTAQEIAGWVRVDFERVVRDLRVENRELWGQVHETLENIGAEVHAGFQGLMMNHQQQMMNHQEQMMHQMMMLQLVEEMRKQITMLKLNPHSSSCPKVPLNPEAQDFWKQNFKDSPEVDCKTFAEALQRRYCFIQDANDLHLIAHGLDIDGDGKVNTEEFRLWAKDGVQSAFARELQKSRTTLAAQAKAVKNPPISGGVLVQWLFECVHPTPAPAQRRWRVTPRLRACALRAFD